MEAGDRLEIGRIARPHGLRGEVVVAPITNRRERFEPGAVHHMGTGELVVVKAREQKGRWVVAYEGVPDRTAAEGLRGAVLTGDPIEVLAEGEMWVHELIGCEVVDTGGTPRGRVIEVEVNPAHDILVLDTGGLVPIVFVSEHEAGRVVVDPPEGLFDDEFVAANRPAVERRRPLRKQESVFRIDVFTVFPDYLEGPLRLSLIGQARESGLLDLRVHDPRTWAGDPHRSVDDAPYGGGPGMVMMPEPLFTAVEAVDPPRPLFLLSAAGELFDQQRATALAGSSGFSLLCGRYEGVDQRVADHLCDGELSVGDFVLAGGEAAALVVVEAVARLIPGVVGNEASAEEESFSGEGATFLEYPQYTRPAEFREWEVPTVLRSGDHGRIARWRRAQALRRTLTRRPDLLPEDGLPAEDRALLDEFPDEE